MRQRKIACLNWRGGVVISAFYVCTNKEAVLFVVTTEKANVALSLVFGRLKCRVATSLPKDFLSIKIVDAEPGAPES